MKPDNVAARNCVFCNFFGGNFIFCYKLCGVFRLGVCKSNAFSVLVNKGFYRVGVLFKKSGAHCNSAHGKLAVAKRFPLFGKVKSNAEGVAFRGYVGNKRLGKHNYVVITLKGKGGGFGVLRRPDNFGNDPVFFKDIVEHILCGAALAGSKNGLSRKVGNGIYAVSVFKNIEYAEGVHAQNRDFAFCLIVQGGYCVGRQRRNIHISVYKLTRNSVGRARNRKIIFICRKLLVVLVHKPCGAHSGRAFEHADIYGNTGLFCF